MTLFRPPATWMFPMNFLTSQSLITLSLYIHASACYDLYLIHSHVPLVRHSSWCYCLLKTGLIHCPETLVTNYQPMPSNIPEDCRPNCHTRFFLCKWHLSFSVFITHLQ
jgi:hypothetical protein